MARFDRWPPFEVESLRNNLQTLQQAVRDEEKTLEPETRGWLARLLIVRSVGFIEQSSVECCRAHVVARGGGWVESFALSYLERSKNPSPENLAGLVGRFDATAADEFDKHLRSDDESLYRDLCSMVDKRNRIAHGLNEGVRPDRALALSDRAIEIADWFVLRFNPYR